jgi:eukaryotic-like serine/threonine-protein kinase
LAELQAGDPARVGPYLLLGRLGAGGMGQVFLGRSPGGRLVAVKVIRAELAEDSGFRTRFAREVAAARRVSGLFTASVVDADPQAPLPWLVTAYVAGPSLAQAVADHGPLPVASVLALAAGLAEGLGAVHAAGVVHRDLKPSNVLLAEDGPRVIDFGISQAADVTLLTGTGMVVGSPGFMSPEQAEGTSVGPASDIFTLGAVLTFAAIGEPPFGIGAATAQLYRVVHGKPRLDQLPDQVRPLVERCLAKDPLERPTAVQFLAELTAAHPSAADLSDWLPEPVLRASRHRAPTAIETPEPAAAPGTGAVRIARSSPAAGDHIAAAPGPGGPPTVTADRLHHIPHSADPPPGPATDVVSPAPAAKQQTWDRPAVQGRPARRAAGRQTWPAKARWAVLAIGVAAARP